MRLVKLKIIIVFIILIALIGTYPILKKFLSNDQKQLLSKYIFPYKMISEQNRIIFNHQEHIYQLKGVIFQNELKFKERKENIQLGKMKDIKLTNNKILKKYILANGFYSGIYNFMPGSGFIDFHQNNTLIVSARGVIGFASDFENELNFKQIDNNINEFINIKQFQKSNKFSLNDLFIFNDKIFISYTEEIKEDCWNTSIIFADINYKYTKFEKLFSSKDCIYSSDEKRNVNEDFNAHSSGGRMVSFDDNNILLSVGEYRNRFLAQDKESINGKIIKININNSDYEIISMGHRNPQGLYFDDENNFILETEHGPQGGDEINLIEIDKIGNREILNYGWAIVSAGEHYGGKIPSNNLRYKKYPLFKSHSEHGFIEPLKTFVPSIGISEIIKIGQNRYVTSSLKDKSLYFFELNNEKKLINLEKVEVFERVRDLNFKDDKLYLFLEDTPSIGVILL
tara:strand:+ start:62 stop:1426 length:1365 start_codon:yes stop_codon:yes gene_type:complete